MKPSTDTLLYGNLEKKMAEIIDEDGPVIYAAWHIPCYAHHNCPNEKPTQSQNAGIGSFFNWNLQNTYDWLTFIFLGLLICVSFVGICMIFGSLFVRECKVNKWYLRRPINHFILALLASDMIMTLIVIPVHMYDLLGGKEKDYLLNPGTCVFRICSHFMSVTSKSWSFVAYIILYHLHDGVIPTKRSVIVGIWAWIVAILISVPGVVFGVNSYIDTEKCTLVPDSSNWGMILYISCIPFFLPSCILTPILLKWSSLRKKLGVNPNISSEYLAQYDEQEDTENKQIASKYYESRNKHPSTILGDGESGAMPVIFVEHLEDDNNSEHSSLTNSVNSITYNISTHGSSDIAKGNNLEVPTLSPRVNSLTCRASKGTLNFLSQDKDFPRILLTLSLLHMVLWAPFFINLIISALFNISVDESLHESIALCTLWLGYIETAITPILIYLLSSFVNKVIKQICTDICCSHKSNSISDTKKVTVT